MSDCPTCGTQTGSGSHCEDCGSSLSTEDRSQLRGGDLVGRYVIGGVLGQGGFGITYFANDPSLNRTVALKELFPDGCIRTGTNVTGRATFGEMRLQFLREAHAMATLPKHPGLAQIYELLETNGTVYLAMEYIDGTTAAKIVHEHPTGLPEARVLSWIVQLAKALDVVHAAGLLHRDVKPDNIIITGNGANERAVLVDFGSAREFADAKTSAMTSLVTRGYAPLEQYGRTQRFGPTIDVYSLGATAYHLLTGFAPPESPDRASGDTLIPLRASDTTNNAITQALSETVSGRTQNMTLLIEQLTASAPALPKPTEPEHDVAQGTTRPRNESASRRPTINSRLVPAIAALVALALMAVFLLTRPAQRVGRRVAASASADIVFTKYGSNESNDGEIYRMNNDGANLTRLTRNNADDYTPSTSLDGNFISFASNRTGNYEIFRMNRNGADLTQLTRTNAEAIDFGPSWSADGNFISFVSNRSGNFEVYRMNRNGANLTRLTRNSAVDVATSWSPDGDFITVVSNRSGSFEVYRMNRNGANLTRLTRNNAVDVAPSWSPDGNFIIFVSNRNGNSEIYRMNRNGANLTRLTRNNAEDLAPSWSPDGNFISFQSNRTGSFEIFRMNRNGANLTRLTRTGSGNATEPRWR